MCSTDIKSHTQLGSYADVVQITASHCVVCRHRLTDAESVEHGIGPVCSRRYYNPVFIPSPKDVQRALGSLAVSDLPPHVIDAVIEREHKAREACNVLVYWASAHYDDKDVVFKCSAVIRDFGYVDLAEKLEHDRTKVGLRFEEDDEGNKILVVSSTKVGWNVRNDYLRVGGKALSREHRRDRWAFPVDKQDRVEAIVGYHYGGHLGVVAEDIFGRTRTGIFTIPYKTYGEYRDALHPPKSAPAPSAPKAPAPNGIRIVSTTGGKTFELFAPYNGAWLSEMKGKVTSRKRRFDWTQYCWVFDNSVRQVVLDLVEKHHGVKL